MESDKPDKHKKDELFPLPYGAIPIVGAFYNAGGRVEEAEIETGNIRWHCSLCGSEFQTGPDFVDEWDPERDYCFCPKCGNFSCNGEKLMEKETEKTIAKLSAKVYK